VVEFAGGLGVELSSAKYADVVKMLALISKEA
jgi:hypothetical protein